VSLEATPTAPDRPDPTDPERAADWVSVGSFKLLARFGLAFAGYADAFATSDCKALVGQCFSVNHENL
jgi:hypothetical protein